MLIRMPPETPEQWRTVRTALESRAKTLQLCLVLLVGSVPFALVLAAAALVALTRISTQPVRRNVR
jgi:hypothetical protein